MNQHQNGCVFSALMISLCQTAFAPSNHGRVCTASKISAEVKSRTTPGLWLAAPGGVGS
jgi:hypothetical protein